jgi:uncharacterized protein YbaR (Trm112 family)
MNARSKALLPYDLVCPNCHGHGAIYLDRTVTESFRPVFREPSWAMVKVETIEHPEPRRLYCEDCGQEFHIPPEIT